MQASWKITDLGSREILVIFYKFDLIWSLAILMKRAWCYLEEECKFKKEDGYKKQ